MDTVTFCFVVIALTVGVAAMIFSIYKLRILNPAVQEKRARKVPKAKTKRITKSVPVSKRTLRLMLAIATSFSLAAALLLINECCVRLLGLKTQALPVASLTFFLLGYLILAVLTVLSINNQSGIPNIAQSIFELVFLIFAAGVFVLAFALSLFNRTSQNGFLAHLYVLLYAIFSIIICTIIAKKFVGKPLVALLCVSAIYFIIYSVAMFSFGAYNYCFFTERTGIETFRSFSGFADLRFTIDWAQKDLITELKAQLSNPSASKESIEAAIAGVPPYTLIQSFVLWLLKATMFAYITSAMLQFFKKTPAPEKQEAAIP